MSPSSVCATTQAHGCRDRFKQVAHNRRDCRSKKDINHSTVAVRRNETLWRTRLSSCHMRRFGFLVSLFCILSSVVASSSNNSNSARSAASTTLNPLKPSDPTIPSPLAQHSPKEALTR